MALTGPQNTDPYRGADSSPRSVSLDDMMAEMLCKTEFNRLYDRWEATIYWMKRGDSLRASIDAHGASSLEAVSNLYQHFNRMKAEGWKRSK